MYVAGSFPVAMTRIVTLKYGNRRGYNLRVKDYKFACGCKGKFLVYKTFRGFCFKTTNVYVNTSECTGNLDKVLGRYPGVYVRHAKWERYVAYCRHLW